MKNREIIVTGNNLINLGDLAKPAEILVQRFCDGVGGVFKPWQIRRVAKAEADAENTKALAAIERDKAIAASEAARTEVGQRAVARMVEAEIRNQLNMEEILGQAIEKLSPESNPENISEDFIRRTFDYCKSVDDPELQALWASLISSEANEPGGSTRQVLGAIAGMEPEDARLFSKFCSFVFSVPISGKARFLPFTTSSVAPLMHAAGVKFDELRHLEVLGLISYESLSSYKFDLTPGDASKSTTFSISQNDEVGWLIVDPCEKFSIDLGNALLTKAGERIAKIIEVQSISGVLDAVLVDQIKVGRWVASEFPRKAKTTP